MDARALPTCAKSERIPTGKSEKSGFCVWRVACSDAGMAEASFTKAVRWSAATTLPAWLWLAACGGRAEQPQPEGNTLPASGASDRPEQHANGGSGAVDTQPERGGSGGGAPQTTHAPHCSSPKPLLESAETGFMRCSEGFIHRTSAEACPYRPRPYPQVASSQADAGTTGQSNDECAMDSDCAGPAGHCQPAWNYQLNVPYLACHRGCTEDADCASDEICRCYEIAGDCVHALCKTDAECATGQQCVGAEPLPECEGETFACSQPDDECTVNGDCTNSDRPLCLLRQEGSLKPSRHCSERLYCG